MAPPLPVGFLATPPPPQCPVPPAQPLLGLHSCFPADIPFRHAEGAVQLWNFPFLFCPKSHSDAALPLGLQDVGPLPLLCRTFRRTLLARASPPRQGGPPQGCLALSPAGAGRTPLGSRLKAAGAHGSPPAVHSRTLQASIQGGWAWAGSLTALVSLTSCKTQGKCNSQHTPLWGLFLCPVRGPPKSASALTSPPAWLVLEEVLGSTL